LPRETEHPEEPSTLPSPDLNPLLNPLLAQNMGRWAETYFTSPPERREQAVMDLLRELEAENSTREDGGDTSPSTMPERASEPVLVAAPWAAEVEPVLVRCQSCGREMPAAQNYCGLCGVRQERRAGPPKGVTDLPDADPQIEEPRSEESARYVSRESLYVPPEHAVYDAATTTNELSPFQSGREVNDRDNSAEEISTDAAPSRPYRFYVGIALAMVILALAYMAWRSTQATSESDRVGAPTRPLATTQAAPPEPTTPNPSKLNPSQTATPDQAPLAQEQAALPSRDAATPASEQASAQSNRNLYAKAAPPATPIAENKPQVEPPEGKGAEELAIAQGYLSGTNGQERNSSEAAKWLWKSMAKHNANATLLLADLYLKGDGVSKNCDQARVLLDSAARAGVKDAGERLQHLQAFGCD
jgi:hypothetical protein